MQVSTRLDMILIYFSFKGENYMGIAGYVFVWVQLYCVGFHCFTTCFDLHGHQQVCRIFYFHMLEGFCFAAFFAFFFAWSYSACFYLCFFLCFPSLFLLFPWGKKHKWKYAECDQVKERQKSIWKKNILHTWRWPCRPKHVVKQWNPT
jgi:hypothetical protein